MSTSYSRPLALVTGASTGIGLELAKQFASNGFETMMAGKERVVSASLNTKVMGRAGRFLPDGVKAEQHRKMAEQGSGRKS
jgi:NADP-dependent 3-hydroxy acid dehydrogenase YdfG